MTYTLILERYDALFYTLLAPKEDETYIQAMPKITEIIPI